MAAMLFLIWIGSGWWATYWNASHDVGAGFFRGQLWIRCCDKGYFSTPVPADYQLGYHPFGGIDWNAMWGRYGGDGYIILPLWPLVLVAFFSAIAAWWCDVRATVSRPRCAGCGYDKAGLRNGVVCPECGH